MYKAALEYFVQTILWPFRFWIKVKLVFAEGSEKFSDRSPILYVLPTQSKTDLFVLRWQCKLAGLPVPSFTANSVRKNKSGYLYLSKLGLFLRRRGKSAPAPLYDLLKIAQENEKFEVQIVPVTIIWGRNPGKQENSLWKLLFSDDENAGYIRKFLIMIFQGRSVFMHVGAAISLKEQAKSGLNVDQVAKKMRRVLRVHFYRQRVATLGPSIYDRSFVANIISQSRPIQDYIQQEESKKSGSRKKLEEKARQYVMEIAAEPRASIIKGFEILLRYVWSRIFDGVDIHNSECIRDLHATHEVVYLTCHRSHIDYLLLGYVLYELGVTAPHTAAGINLNFWPIGRLIRACGAFFIRRSFRGNRLYSLVFNEYMHFLLTKGYAINFFPEGGRSRTGRTLPAKTGMISMIVHSYIRDTDKPIALIPVYVGYDNVVEIGSYLKELRGKAKKKESFQQLLGAIKIFRKKYGKAYVNFGPPLQLGPYLRDELGLWDGKKFSYLNKPEWFGQSVSQISTEVMSRINGAVVVSPIALSAMAILSTPQKAVAESDFRRFFGTSMRLLNIVKNYYPSIKFSNENEHELADLALSDSALKKFKYPGDDVLYLSDLDAVMFNYYKNNIVHIFVGISIIANQFNHNDRLPREKVVQSAVHLFPFIDREYYVGLNSEIFRKMIEEILDGFLFEGLLNVDADNNLIRPHVTTEEFTTLRHFGNAIGGVFERYGIGIALLHQNIGHSIDFTGFEESCAKLSERISLLNGQLDLNSFDKVHFRGFVESIKKLGYVREDESGKIQSCSTLDDLFNSLSSFLSQDIISSVKRSQILGDKINAEN